MVGPGSIQEHTHGQRALAVVLRRIGELEQDPDMLWQSDLSGIMESGAAISSGLAFVS